MSTTIAGAEREDRSALEMSSSDATISLLVSTGPARRTILRPAGNRTHSVGPAAGELCTPTIRRGFGNG